ncbi:uncharacterized protein LOC108626467 isoform X2 [Ceratina calcarata]|uniref:Uncharacterized protein LOC108626467 isoform X2 n=1 Tax=Ceratina calcarata TaxID=156304 RepID=A0AAJ7N893_9HYME|nr:uncharacterized protein LOC108626467 isoform X2 [Ceratina calcarata]
MSFARSLCASLLLVLTLYQVIGHVHAKNDNFQINDVCSKNYMRDVYRKIDGAVLISQLEKDVDCTITFQTHSILQRFMLRFDQLQLDCNDHLYIYDGAHAVSSYKKVCERGQGRFYWNVEATNFSNCIWYNMIFNFLFFP